MYKKLTSILLITLLMVGLVISGCQKDESEKDESKAPEVQGEEGKEGEKIDGGNMVFRVDSDAMVIHPLYGNDRTTLTVINNLFSPLYRMKGEDIDYGLAEDVNISDDNLTYTVKLKDGLKWHDGEAITADDLVFTFNTIMDEKQGSHLRDNFVTPAGLVKIEKVDESTINFILPEVQVAFLYKLGGVKMFPEHIYKGIENIEADNVNDTPVGSGPFKFEAKKAGESITLSRFDDYFGGKPNLEKVIYKIIPEDASADIAFRNGETDAQYIYNFKNIDKFAEEGANILKFDEDRVGYIILNQNNELLQNDKLRQAIGYALDREELIKARYVSTEYAEPTKTFLAKNALYKTDDVEEYKYNPEKAKKLIEESGLKDVKLTMTYIGNENTLELLVQQYLQEVGIEVELKSMDRAAFFNALFNPENRNEYDLAYNGYIYGKEPASYAQVFKTDSMNNVNNYKNAEVDKLFDEADKETDKAKRSELYKKIQQIVIKDIPMYPVEYKNAVVAINPKFKGLEEAGTAPIHMFDDLSKIYMTE